MEKKKLKINYNTVVIALSILFFVVLITTYTYRLIRYYHYEPKQEELTFKETILNNSIGKGLVQKEDTYLFQGKVENNYVSYSGMLWRIIKIDKDGTISLALNEPITSLVFGYETNDFSKSYLVSWLNKQDKDDHSGFFYQGLKDPETYLEKGTFCIDAITDLKKITCEKTFSAYVGVLSLLDYQNAGLQGSYLNQEFNEWFLNGSSPNQTWNRLKDGKLSDKSNNGTNYYSYGVRPVIRLKASVVLNSGNGSKEKPYQVGGTVASQLKDQALGSYFSYSGANYRVVEKNKDGVMAAMDGYWTASTGNPVLEFFSYSSNQFDLEDQNSLAYDLNHKFKATLSNTDYLTKGSFATGYYGSSSKYDYHSLYESSIKAEVGLLNPSNPYLFDLDDCYTLTGTSSIEDMVYTIKNGSLYADHILTEKKIRPALYFKNDLKITGGLGTKESPYQISK